MASRLLHDGTPNGCLRDHSACHAPGNTHAPPQASTKGTFLAPMIRRRSAASSSFVLAATRLRALQQDPTCAATLTRAATSSLWGECQVLAAAVNGRAGLARRRVCRRAVLLG